MGMAEDRGGNGSPTVAGMGSVISPAKTGLAVLVSSRDYGRSNRLLHKK
jgi:hypothetical protein